MATFRISTALKNTRYPFQVEIAAVFTLLVAILGITLVWYNYSENKQIILLAAEDLFGRITDHTGANIRALYAPTETLVDLTAQLETTETETLPERLGLLAYFAESLTHDKRLSSIYVGYDNGDLFLVRAIRRNAAARETLDAPEAARFAVQSIERTETGEARQTIFYYDETLATVGTRDATETEFDPRQRRWYRLGIASDEQITSGFYTFYTTGEVGTTIARRTPNGRGVVGADLTLQELSTGLAKQRVTPSSKILVFDAEGMVLAYPEHSQAAGEQRGVGETEGLRVHMSEFSDPVLEALYRQYTMGMTQDQLRVTVGNRDWMGSISSLPLRSGHTVNLAILVPHDELLADLNRLRTHSLLISFALLVVAVGAVWWIAGRISNSLRTLASEAERIRELKLDTPITVRSRVVEVDDLAVTMAVMKAAIQRFVDISKALSAETDFAHLLQRILEEARVVCAADGGSICLLDRDQRSLQLALIHNERAGMRHGKTSDGARPSERLSLPEGEGGQQPVLIEAHTLRTGMTVVVDDMDQEIRFDFSRTRKRYEQAGYHCQSLLHLPLRNRQGEVMGLLELINARDIATDQAVAFRPEIVSYVEALSSQAAIVLDNRRLLKEQKELLDSFVQLIASAIDAKSPYTSGHCQRVPELARMLAEAAQESDAEPFKDFSLSEEEWYELYMASWLHDCGKITSPEYVVDKATKLESIYNRLHEIRMRFEVLLRDAQIAYYKALAHGDTREAVLRDELDERLNQLQDDFGFVAECNVGSEFMAPERIQRLKAIAAQTWLRHFDDRIGLSAEELARKQSVAKPDLPAREFLLADKDEHIVPRDDDGHPFGDNPHGFKMEVPAHAFNYGELHNLSIARGTLTEEDRFKINEHIIQTIVLLNKLPFPRELRRVPQWAGNHHEKLDGTGYPRRLEADALSIPERIMAVADIFEALTAADRPYKKAKTLSESIRLMSFMRNDGHICPQLFELFLTSGVYSRYAHRFLSAEQIDQVDISQFLGRGSGQPIAGKG